MLSFYVEYGTISLHIFKKVQFLSRLLVGDNLKFIYLWTEKKESEDPAKTKIQWDPGIDNPAIKSSVNAKNAKILVIHFKKLKIEMIKETRQPIL